MTMIDEDVLSEALHGAAETIEVPVDAAERIVAATQVTPADRLRCSAGPVAPSRPRPGPDGLGQSSWRR